MASDIVVLDLSHFLSVLSDILFAQKYLEAVLAYHLQHHYQMFEVPDVINWETQLRMPKVTHTHLEISSASRAPQQLSSYTHSAVDRPIGDRCQRTIVELKVANFGFGDVQDIFGRKDREIDRFSESRKYYMREGLLSESAHLGIISLNRYYKTISFI